MVMALRVAVLVSMYGNMICASAEKAACDETLGGSNGDEYRGCQTITTSGKTCVNWQALSRDIGNHNYCRNPDGEEITIWCFTSRDGDWGYCDQITADAAQSHHAYTKVRACRDEAGDEPNFYYYSSVAMTNSTCRAQCTLDMDCDAYMIYTRDGYDGACAIYGPALSAAPPKWTFAQGSGREVATVEFRSQSFQSCYKKIQSFPSPTPSLPTPSPTPALRGPTPEPTVSPTTGPAPTPSLTVDPQEQELTDAAFGVAMSRTALIAIALAIFV